MFHLKNLTIRFKNQILVDRVSFRIKKGQILSLVGESGSGKSITAKALCGLSAPGLDIDLEMKINSEIYRKENEIKPLRGIKMGFIFQDPFNAFNPQFRIGDQIREVLDIHKIGEKKLRNQRVIQILEKFHLTPPERIFNSYPHMLSGGMAQRAFIASAMIAQPEILIADEPTTALDVLTQEEILKLLREISHEGVTMLFITHNLQVARKMSDQIAVMFQGKIVEKGSVKTVLNDPWHPYTISLLDSVAQLGKALKRPLIASIEKNLACPFFSRCVYRAEICRTVLNHYQEGDREVLCNRKSYENSF